MKVLKLVSLVFVQPLMRLINLSIQSGCFPTKWKMAHVYKMVFVDFRKAFDVVDHQLLLTKLRLYRVSDPSLLWFESYLSGRQQFVSVDGQRSDSLLIKQGVPQGSVLGPALFLLFVNDIPLHLTNSTVDIYADDTTITASAHFSDLCSMTQHLNSNLDAVQRWASCNKMFINKKKTKSKLAL